MPWEKAEAAEKGSGTFSLSPIGGRRSRAEVGSQSVMNSLWLVLLFKCQCAPFVFLLSGGMQHWPNVLFHAIFKSEAVGKNQVDKTPNGHAEWIQITPKNYNNILFLPHSAASRFQMTILPWLKPFDFHFSPAPEWPPRLHRLFLCSSWRLRSSERLIRASSRSWTQHSRATSYLKISN